MESPVANTTMASLARSEEAERLMSISEDIRASYIWVVFCLGFPGSIFSIITILTMRTVTPATFFVSWLAVCDGVTLVLKLIMHQVYFHNVYLGTAGCKTEFLASYTSVLANWALVMICAERFVSVCLPLKRNIIFTKRRCYIVVASMTVVFFFIFGSVYWAMRDATPDGLVCGVIDEYVPFWTSGWYWINICLNLFIPLPLIIFFTILIIRGLRRSRRDRRSILHNGSGNEEANRRMMKETERLERTITVMLILAAIVFALISLPTVVYLLAYEPSQDPLTQAKWSLFDQIQYLCIDSSHAINFFLYFFTAKKFREHFLFLVSCGRCAKGKVKVRRQEVTHSLETTKYTMAKSNDDVSHI